MSHTVAARFVRRDLDTAMAQAAYHNANAILEMQRAAIAVIAIDDVAELLNARRTPRMLGERAEEAHLRRAAVKRAQERACAYDVKGVNHGAAGLEFHRHA